MSPITRFAPSPTGRVHIGNIRTAILNWLFARKHDGTFILRLDDTDRERSTEAFADGIREDLSWLGLAWTREERQSARAARYEEMATKLRHMGRLYPCYESEDELDRRRKRQRARGLPPIYDRASLKLTDAERRQLEREGCKPHWRFRLANTEADSLDPVSTFVSWNDLIRGDQMVDVGSLSDPVVIRANGAFLYTFTSVVDDIDFGISHVIRGEDHVTNTGVQMQLFEAFGKDPPTFAHHAFLVGADGQGLSKRLGALSVESFRAAGLEAMTVNSQAALVGTSDAVEPYPSLDALAKVFSLDKISTAPARFDEIELRALNARYLHALDYEAVAPRLKALGIGGDAEFWRAVRGNLEVLDDARRWWRVVSDSVTPVIENAGLTSHAASLLPPEPWGADVWPTWTRAITAETGAKGRALFHPLRLALTGQEDGPELKALLPLIGRARAEGRLMGRVS